MTFERRPILDQETQSSDSATRRRPLPRFGALSALELIVRCTNGSTAGEEHVVDAIDRVEVVADGSNVLFSLEGVELHRWSWFWYQESPPADWNEAASAVQMLALLIPFGRYLGDPEVWLDLGDFRDVELRVQYSPTIAATSFATGTFEISAIAWIDDDEPRVVGRRGWLRTTQVNAFTSAASGDTITELARQYPYYDIGVYAREDAIDDGTDISRAQVWVDSKRRIPFDGRWDHIQEFNETFYSIDPTMTMRALRADNVTIDMLTGRIIDCQVQIEQDLAAGADYTIAQPASVAGDRITTHMAIIEGSATYAATILETTRRKLYVEARGLGVGNFINIPFCLHGNLDLALPAPASSRVELVLTNAGAGADVRVSTRELVPAA